jgi:hypothetical protein
VKLCLVWTLLAENAQGNLTKKGEHQNTQKPTYLMHLVDIWLRRFHFYFFNLAPLDHAPPVQNQSHCQFFALAQALKMPST